MILKDNYAIIETVEEQIFLYKYADNIIAKENNNNWKASKKLIKKGLIIGNNMSCFVFDNFSIHLNPNGTPNGIDFSILKKRKSFIESNNKKYYYMPVNILTINKTIKELYELGKWCSLWL